jgi:hypothetical protein
VEGFSVTIYEATKKRLALRLKRIVGAHRLGNMTRAEMQTQRTREIQQARQQVEALKRIPTDTPARITYFSVHDEWVFTAVFDNRVCPHCLAFENQTFTGNLLRAKFPYLEIVDLETIIPNVHPHCRCRLERVLYFGDIGVEK